MLALSHAELGILNWIYTHCHTRFLDAIMPVITWLGDKGLLWILLGLGILLFQKGKRDTGFRVLLALLFGLLLCNLLLKNAVGRIRPFTLNDTIQLLVTPPQDPSFPSGHTTAAFAAASVLIRDHWKGRWVVLIAAILVAFSRLYLYVHFPTDVLCGALIGIFCGWLSTQFWQKLIGPYWAKRQKKEPS